MASHTSGKSRILLQMGSLLSLLSGQSFSESDVGVSLRPVDHRILIFVLADDLPVERYLNLYC